MNSREPLPFIDSLKYAAKMHWSGLLRAKRADQQVGAVVMHDGRVAWAFSTSLDEDFGSVLARVGLVSREKLAAANHALQNHRTRGNTMSLGSLLVEECLISHTVLRTCFKTHVSAALASLAAIPQLSPHPVEERMSVDESLLFRLNEVLPSLGKGRTTGGYPVQAASGTEAALESDFLKGLVLLPGYRYSFVADMGGKLLACHTADGVTIELENRIPKALTWLSAACAISSESEMGTVDSAFLQGESGSLFAQMTDASNRFFMAVSFGTAGKLGVIKHKISELIPAVRRYTDTV